MSDLRPCPFCGGSLKIYETDAVSRGEYGGAGARHYVSCNDCPFTHKPNFSTKEGLIEHINNRPQLDEAVEALEKCSIIGQKAKVKEATSCLKAIHKEARKALSKVKGR